MTDRDIPSHPQAAHGTTERRAMIIATDIRRRMAEDILAVRAATLGEVSMRDLMALGWTEEQVDRHGQRAGNMAAVNLAYAEQTVLLQKKAGSADPLLGIQARVSNAIDALSATMAAMATELQHLKDLNAQSAALLQRLG
jgi:hypothetical protein